MGEVAHLSFIQTQTEQLLSGCQAAKRISDNIGLWIKPTTIMINIYTRY